jgi:ATP-binding cassette subfamily C (CFTR/MRP) protein 1
MGARQVTWNQATQERITATSLVLSSIKSIKLMGFAKYIVTDIRRLRDNEIQKSRQFRKFTVVLNFIGKNYWPENTSTLYNS